MALERIHDVSVSIGAGTLEIRPETTPAAEHRPSAGAAPTGDRAPIAARARAARAARIPELAGSAGKYDGTSFVEATIEYVARRGE